MRIRRNKTRAQTNRQALKVDAEIKCVMSANFKVAPKLNQEICSVYFANKLLLTRQRN
jgi:hypothetical protein